MPSGLFHDADEWQILFVEKINLKDDSAMVYAWPMEEDGDQPTVFFMRQGSKPYGKGVHKYFDKEWGVVSPTDPIVAKWASRPPYSPKLDLTMFGDEMEKMFSGIGQISKVPRGFYEDLNGEHLQRLRRAGEEKSGWFDSMAMRYALFAFLSIVVLGIFMIILSG